jgi:hypothetical protein
MTSGPDEISLSDFRRLLAEPPPTAEPRDTSWFFPLAWIALAPAWPELLAREGFPNMGGEIKSGTAVVKTLEAMELRGLIRSGPGEPPPEGTWFWVDRQQRAAAFNDILRSTAHGLVFLSEQLSEAAHAMREVAGGAPLNPTLARWLHLVAAEAPSRMAQIVDREIATAIDLEARAGGLSCPEARRWIETAEPLAELFGGHLEVAVERGRRRLEQFRRNARDKRQLRNYYPRPALEQALRDLVTDESSNNWALHYVGRGGAGKTMLVQRARTTLAEELSLAVGHIDFDNLNPDYPRRAPGLLLMGFAEDLRLDDDPAIAEIFGKFDDAIETSHKRLGGANAEGDSIGSHETHEFELARRHFVSALRAIHEKHRRPVLILDTCEELARIRIDGRLPDNVSFTFRLLKRIHDEVPFLRVVFSGRRALARKGVGWEWPDVTLPELDYLRLCEVLPFDGSEARGFLTQYADTSGESRREVPRYQHKAILKLCRIQPRKDERIEFDIHWTDGRVLRRRVRYNPYDIDLLARWATSPEGLDFNQLKAFGIHFHVKERVIDRIDLEVRPFVPDLALLGRFDRALLEQMIRRRGRSFENFWEYIQSLEWTYADRDAAAEHVWAIDPHYRRRLLAYFRDNDRAALEISRGRVWALLERATLDRPLSALTPAYFVACLAAAPRDGVAAASWWEKVENRFITKDAGRWDWAKRATDALLAEDDSTQPRPDWSLYPAIRATAAAATLHLGLDLDASGWELVASEADLHPDPIGREKLRARARFGAFAAVLRSGRSALRSTHDGNVWGMLKSMPLNDEQLQGAALAACEAGVERIENMLPSERSEYKGLLELFSSVLGAFDPPLYSFALGLCGRIKAMEGDRSEASSYLERAIKTAVDSGARSRHWLDWRSPDDLEARLRLELARLTAPPRSMRTASETIDGERLKAAALAWEMRVRVPAIDVTDLKPRQVTPRCNAHRVFPPLFAVAIEAQAATGDVENALSLARAISVDASLPLEIRRHADRALLNFAVPMLLFEEKVGIETTLNDSTTSQDQALAEMLRDLQAGLWTIKGIPVPGGAFPRARRPLRVGGNPPDEPGPREEGERLFLMGLIGIHTRALRQPDYFEEARKHYESAKDNLGVLLCTIAAAVKKPRSASALSETLDAIFGNPSFPKGKFARPRSDAPAADWTSFVEATSLGWRPWITRVAALAIRAQEFDKQGERTREFRSWLYPRYHGTHFPADLAALLPISLRQAIFGPEWRKYREATAAVLGGAMGLGILAFLYYAFSLGVSAVGIDLPTWASITAFILVLGIVGLIGSFLEERPGFLRSRVGRLFAPRIAIDMATHVPRLAVPLATPNDALAFSWSVKPLVRFGLHLGKVGVTTYSSFEEPYAKQAEVLPAETRKSVHRLFGITWSPTAVVIELDERAAAAPWEAIFGMPIGDPIDASTKPFHSFQRRQTGRSIYVDAAPGEIGVLTLYADLSAARFAPPAWDIRTKERAPFGYRFEAFSFSDGLLRQDATVDVLHVVGRPVETAGGLRLRFDRENTPTPVEASADQLATRYPMMRLCIFQDFPEEPRSRNSSDRYTASLGRRFSFQLQRVGISAVVMLPALPLELSGEVVSELARAIAGRPRTGVSALEIALVKVRQIISDRAGSERAEALELAFDVVFQAPERLNFGGRITTTAGVDEAPSTHAR